jgi:hypothetical protein
MFAQRIALIASAALAAVATVPTGLAPAAIAATPGPVASLDASTSPHGRHVRPGTPLTFTLDTRFTSSPPGGDFVLQRLEYLFPGDAVVNGRLFPSCSAPQLARAHGRLSACPQGSKIGSGHASGTAVAIGVTSHATVTLFNGPGGNSITMNVSITTPALINATFSAPLVTLHHGRYANKLTIVVPDSLETILDGDIVTSDIHVTTGATRVVRGIKRGYIEAAGCPRSGKASIHGDFTFDGNVRATADTTVRC